MTGRNAFVGVTLPFFRFVDRIDINGWSRQCFNAMHKDFMRSLFIFDPKSLEGQSWILLRKQVSSAFRRRDKRMLSVGVLAFTMLWSCRSGINHATLQDIEPPPDAIDLSGFDVNDVAYLFPKIQGINEASPRIAADELTQDGQAFIPDSVFRPILEFSEKIRPGNLRANALNRASWRLQSFRFDPCAPLDASFRSLSFAQMAQGHDKEDCQIEIRTIMQPMEPLGVFAGSGHVADVSMHLTYRLGQGSSSPVLSRLIEELKSLKILSEALPNGRTSGVPLGRHPGLYAELVAGGAERAFADRVKSFLQRNVSATKLIRVTFSAVDSSTSTRWVFFGGSVAVVAGAAVWTPAALPTESGVESIEYHPDHVRSGTAIIPLPSTLSTNPLFTPSSVGRGVAINPTFGVGSSGQTLPIAEAQAIINQIENPTETNIFNTDCVSCHTTTSRAFTLGIPATGVPDRPRGITGYALAPAYSLRDIQQRNNTEGLQTNLWNVRNFGWFDWQATVSNRTVNEAMASALYINGLFFKGKNPGLDCVDADREGAVSTCLLAGKGIQCLDACVQSDRRR